MKWEEENHEVLIDVCHSAQQGKIQLHDASKRKHFVNKLSFPFLNTPASQLLSTLQNNSEFSMTFKSSPPKTKSSEFMINLSTPNLPFLCPLTSVLC